MVVALADSFFFDVDPSGARSKVLAFLLVSFAPFLLVAPFIGPAIDRVRGGRRFVVQAVAAARIVVQLLMIRFADDTRAVPAGVRGARAAEDVRGVEVGARAGGGAHRHASWSRPTRSSA